MAPVFVTPQRRAGMYRKRPVPRECPNTGCREAVPQSLFRLPADYSLRRYLSRALGRGAT